MKTYSLKGKVLLNFSIPLLLTIVLVSGLIFFFVREEVEKIYDSQMEQLAHTILVLTRHEAMEGEDIQKTLNPENKTLRFSEGPLIAYRIWNKNTIIVQSQEAEVLGEKSTTLGFTEIMIGNDEWRIFTLADNNRDISIEVAQKCWPRIFLILQIFESLLFPFIILAASLIWMVKFNLNKAFLPLHKISKEVDHCDANDLQALSPPRLPEEISGFMSAINRLFLRLRESMDREREFTDNAAHELRTPLAAVKVRAQIISKKIEKSGLDLKGDLDDLLSSIDRTATVVDQMLAFARLQQEKKDFSTIDLSSLIRTEIGAISLHATAKDQTLDVKIDPDLKTHGHIGALSTLIRNLADNAVRYTPRDGLIKIEAKKENNHVFFQISDTGPGIEDSKKERVFERFLRFNSTEEGTGLGLSIVKSICDAHDAQIYLSDNIPRGLTVTVLFPQVYFQ